MGSSHDADSWLRFRLCDRYSTAVASRSLSAAREKSCRTTGSGLGSFAAGDVDRKGDNGAGKNPLPERGIVNDPPSKLRRNGGPEKEGWNELASAPREKSLYVVAGSDDAGVALDETWGLGDSSLFDLVIVAASD